MDQAIQAALQFLVDQHSFHRSVREGAVSYQSGVLVITPSFDERDGFETDIEFRSPSPCKVAVGTLLCALDVSAPQELNSHAAFLQSRIGTLTASPPTIHDDLSALRFWHAPPRRQYWGKSITMDRSSIEVERERLVRLQSYFDYTPGSSEDHDSRSAVV